MLSLGKDAFINKLPMFERLINSFGKWR